MKQRKAIDPYNSTPHSKGWIKNNVITLQYYKTVLAQHRETIVTKCMHVKKHAEQWGSQNEPGTVGLHNRKGCGCRKLDRGQLGLSGLALNQTYGVCEPERKSNRVNEKSQTESYNANKWAVFTLVVLLCSFPVNGQTNEMQLKITGKEPENDATNTLILLTNEYNRVLIYDASGKKIIDKSSKLFGSERKRKFQAIVDKYDPFDDKKTLEKLQKLIGTNQVKIPFFYNTEILTEQSFILTRTQSILSNNVILVPLPYKKPNEFVDSYQKHVTAETPLVLGPTDSESMRGLELSFPEEIRALFLAPFVTTSKNDYKRLDLEPASPTDQDRVEQVIEMFINQTTAQALGIIYFDNAWGRGIFRNMHTVLAKAGDFYVQGLPVRERNSLDTYKNFFKLMRSRAIHIIVIAFYNYNRINEVLRVFDHNNDTLVKYKPSIIIMRDLEFGTNLNLMINAEYTERFDIYNISETEPSVQQEGKQQSLLFNHFDACNVLAASIEAGDQDPSNVRTYIEGFYEHQWPGDGRVLKKRLETSFHKAKLGHTNEILTVYRNFLEKESIQREAMGRLRAGGLTGFISRAEIFMKHHNFLWHPIVLPAFIIVSWCCFAYFTNIKIQKGLLYAIKESAFWWLFVMNFFVVYLIWFASNYFFEILDNNWYITFSIAAIAPMAIGGFGSWLIKFAPVDLSGVFWIVEEAHRHMLRRIGEESLRREFEDVETTRGAEELKRELDELLQKVQNKHYYERMVLKKHNFEKRLGESIDRNSRDSKARHFYGEMSREILGYLSESNEDYQERLREKGWLKNKSEKEGTKD